MKVGIIEFQLSVAHFVALKNTIGGVFSTLNLMATYFERSRLHQLNLVVLVECAEALHSRREIDHLSDGGRELIRKVLPDLLSVFGAKWKSTLETFLKI